MYAHPKVSVLYKRNLHKIAWRDTIVLSPAHQNPVKAPPAETPEDLKLDQSLNSDANLTSRSLHSLERRDGGPLYCNDGPCIDGRYVSLCVSLSLILTSAVVVAERMAFVVSEITSNDLLFT